MSSNTDHSLLTISEESTCYSLSFDFDDSCDKCKKFHERKIGISGRKPGKHAIPLCEKPWFIPLTECNYTRLSIKKQLAIDILNSKGYTTNDNKCKTGKRSKLYYTPPSQKRIMRQKPISSGCPQSAQPMHSSDELLAAESISALSRFVPPTFSPPTFPPLTIPRNILPRSSESTKKPVINF